jgi:hypothetical protein
MLTLLAVPTELYQASCLASLREAQREMNWFLDGCCEANLLDT